MTTHSAMGRREFVTRVAATAATSAFAVSALKQAAASEEVTTALEVKTASAETFRPCIGQTFEVGGKKLVLDKVHIVSDRHQAKRPRGIRQESFSLIFSAPLGTRLNTGIWTFSNADLGRFTVYFNEVRLPTNFSTNSALGQAEVFLNRVTTNVEATTPKVYYEVPFN